VALLAVIYTLAQVGLQGVVSSGRLASSAEAGTTLVVLAHVLGGGFWAQAMALAIALSGVAATGTGIAPGARLVSGRASDRALPGFLSSVSRRYATPAYASIFVGVLVIVLSAVYYLATTVQHAFEDVIAVTSFLFSIFYIMTALAAVVYYRRRVFRSAWDTLSLGILPLGAAGVLCWVLVKSLLRAAAAPDWLPVGIVLG